MLAQRLLCKGKTRPHFFQHLLSVLCIDNAGIIRIIPHLWLTITVPLQKLKKKTDPGTVLLEVFFKPHLWRKLVPSGRVTDSPSELPWANLLHDREAKDLFG